MSFDFCSIKRDSTTIHLLEHDEFDPNQFLENLTDIELERLHKFSHIKRKREFVATRILRHNLFGFEHIHYDAFGAPFIEQEGFISISHSKNKVAIALNTQHQIGIDLEPHRPNILKVANKFLSKKEREIFDCDDTLTVTQMWSAKETLYKLAGRKKIIFSSELALDKDEKGNWIGVIDNYDHFLEVKLDIFDFKETIITLNSGEIEKRIKHT